MNPIETTADERTDETDGSTGRRDVADLLDASDRFADRHVGPDAEEVRAMLRALGLPSIEALIDQTVPPSIRISAPLAVGPPRGEHELLGELQSIARCNLVFRSCIGMGYADSITPPVIQRNILENPGWYTQYTPYQAEISQGRLEALLVFQTMVADLTALPLANASLLDEATAAAEAMSMCLAIGRGARRRFVVDAACHPQTIAVVRTRARSLGIDLEVAAHDAIDLAGDDLCGILLQYPTTDGRIFDHGDLVRRVHDAGGLVAVACDLLALTLIAAPGDFGADIAVGSSQRFGVPLGGGGPHAAFLATRQEHARKMPGRMIGVSRDAVGRTAYRMAIQTREQHIKRERATSNICTAQVLLAIMAGMYAVYHGPEGLRRIARRVNAYTRALAGGLAGLGHDVGAEPCFDTLRVRLGSGDAERVHRAAVQRGVNLRRYEDGSVGVTLDETTTRDGVREIIESFAGGRSLTATVDELVGEPDPGYPVPIARCGEILTHEVFSRYRTETELLRYLTWLQSRDLSLASSMIPLGSCTMKLNGTTEMLPVSWPEFARIHPFAPADQLEGYAELFRQLEGWIAEITGFPAVSLQPNAGSQGEYSGLLTIGAYHEHRGEPHRDVCLIPVSAHGTNPASAVIAGYRVVPVACDAEGNVDLDDLRTKASAHADALGALMITYPSTHGVFEASIQEVCRIVHDHGGQVYLDGANLNAQVGLCRPIDLGADVCHLNLHKTFCIPHGGGGPGMGPIAAAAHLAPFLPTHPAALVSGGPPADVHAVGAVSAAPYGSPGILPISWMYIALMGGAGLTRATEVAILNANYMAHRLEGHYDVLFRGERGRVAHEFIIDCRPFERSAGIRIEDIAKRLMDYGFHAPTMAWPVPGTLMIEPTESESKAEIDRFCDALIAIREEIRAIERGAAEREDNALRNAPHTIEMVSADVWSHAYPREQAAFPLPWLRDRKFWPPVARVDNPYGDRHLVCTCPSDWASG